jgi:predicted  nucleic acid-binding Zn-ribbon protein
MTEYESEGQESEESFNQQATHECRRCGHRWQYTGSAARPTCPSCSRKLLPEEQLGEPTEYTIVDLSGEYGDGPRFDVDATIDTEEETGEVTICLGLTKAEAEAMWEKISGHGHEYPEDARERVLEAMNYNVQRAAHGD